MTCSYRAHPVFTNFNIPGMQLDLSFAAAGKEVNRQRREVKGGGGEFSTSASASASSSSSAYASGEDEGDAMPIQETSITGTYVLTE